MKGVILAGGSGSRMGLLALGLNKHLLPVAGEPMILHPVRKLAGAGVRDVLVVTSPEGVGPIARLLGDGSRFSCRVTYRVQESPGGVADALSLAGGFCGGSPICVLLGDNVFHDPLGPFLDAARKYAPWKAWVWVKGVPDARAYGVPVMRDGRVSRVVEKPDDPDALGGHFAVVGVYAYPPGVFAAVASLSPSPRGELEITDLNNSYAGRRALGDLPMQGWWVDAGTPESLAEADRLAREEPPLW